MKTLDAIKGLTRAVEFSGDEDSAQAAKMDGTVPYLFKNAPFKFTELINDPSVTSACGTFVSQYPTTRQAKSTGRVQWRIGPPQTAQEIVFVFPVPFCEWSVSLTAIPSNVRWWLHFRIDSEAQHKDRPRKH